MSAAAVRRDEWADAVFDAVRALRAALADPATSLKAAVELLKLEVARIRHGRAVAGTDVRDDLGELGPLGAGPVKGSAMDQLDDADRELVRELTAMFAGSPDCDPSELADDTANEHAMIELRRPATAVDADRMGGGRGSRRAASLRQAECPGAGTATEETASRCPRAPGSAGASPSPGDAHQRQASAPTREVSRCVSQSLHAPYTNRSSVGCVEALRNAPAPHRSRPSPTHPRR
ncbi:MAG: hypothetical protein U0871_21375 [Gemmataceae bacterium]